MSISCSCSRVTGAPPGEKESAWAGEPISDEKRGDSVWLTMDVSGPGPGEALPSRTPSLSCRTGVSYCASRRACACSATSSMMRSRLRSSILRTSSTSSQSAVSFSPSCRSSADSSARTTSRQRSTALMACVRMSTWLRWGILPKGLSADDMLFSMATLVCTSRMTSRTSSTDSIRSHMRSIELSIERELAFDAMDDAEAAE